MSATKAVYVLVHGAWHSHSAWDRVTPILRANDFAVLTLDLPGAGVNAIAPTSLGHNPFDSAAFAAEPSPTAGVTQEERTQAVVALVKEAASLGDGKVILVGHSAGGMTIAMVDRAIGGNTTIHTLESSHSPFLSQPAALAKILIDIGVQSLAQQSGYFGSRSPS